MAQAGGVLIDVARRQRRVQGQQLRAVDAQRSLDCVGWLHDAAVLVSRAARGDKKNADIYISESYAGGGRTAETTIAVLHIRVRLAILEGLPCVTQRPKLGAL